MAMSSISNAARSAMCNALVDLVDAGADGLFQIMASNGTTLLAQLKFADPAFGAASNGVATAGTFSADSSAETGGAANKFVVLDSASLEIWRGNVGASSGADLHLNTITITAGDTVNITSGTVTMPAS